MDIRVTWHRYGDVAHPAVTHSWILRQRHHPFVIDQDNLSVYGQVLPLNLSSALTLGEQYLAVGLGYLHYQRGFLARRYRRPFWHAQLNRRYRNLRQVHTPSHFYFHRAAAGQRQA